MKKFKALFLALLITFSACMFACDCQNAGGKNNLSGSDLDNAEKYYIKWEGRYEYKTNEDTGTDSVYLYHTATGFTVDFTGTELKVSFNSKISGDSESRYPYYNVSVDDEIIPTVDRSRTFFLTGGEQEITVVSGLKNGKHTVKCLKMSEPYDAETSITGFKTDGEFIERNKEDDNSNFRFMFVCASGGSGHGSLGYSERNGSAARTTANSSSLHAFNYLTARMFGADVQFVANSGWGVAYPSGKSITDVIDYTGITISNNVSGALTTAEWDYNKWIPDVIIFNIGGNDTGANGFNQSVYQDRVVELVENLHEHYPNAKMIWTHTESNAGRYAVSALTDAGILSEGYMVIGIIPKVGSDGTYGANGHNSFKTHITSADILANILTEEWGYTKINDNVSFDDYNDILLKF